VKQLAIEHPMSARTTPISFEVISSVEPETKEFIVVNSPPTFEEPLPETVDIIKTTEAQAWFLKLANAVDIDPEDTVSLSVKLGPATKFMQFESDLATFKIDDLSSDLLVVGSFKVTVTLDDGTDTSTHTIVVTVHEVKTPADDLDELNESFTNSTTTTEGSEADGTDTNLPAAAVEQAKNLKQITETVKVYRKSIMNRKRVPRSDPDSKK